MESTDAPRRGRSASSRWALRADSGDTTREEARWAPELHVDFRDCAEDTAALPEQPGPRRRGRGDFAMSRVSPHLEQYQRLPQPESKDQQDTPMRRRHARSQRALCIDDGMLTVTSSARQTLRRSSNEWTDREERLPQQVMQQALRQACRERSARGRLSSVGAQAELRRGNLDTQ